MKSRSARLVLFVLFGLALGGDRISVPEERSSASRPKRRQVESFNAKARDAARHVLDLRAAQQAYVATGQGAGFLDRARHVDARQPPGEPDGAAGLGSVGREPGQHRRGRRRLQDFAQMDARAREYVRTNQNLLPADMIFSNGNELTDAAMAAIDKATASELAVREKQRRTRSAGAQPSRWSPPLPRPSWSCCSCCRESSATLPPRRSSSGAPRCAAQGSPG